MYSELLESALDVDEPSESEVTTTAALARVLNSRCRIGTATSSPGRSPYDAIVDDLNYDVALICLARHLDIVCHVGDFDQHHAARNRLEQALAEKGIRLEELDEQTTSNPTSHESVHPGTSG